jgi:hypothetical protein
MLEQVSVLIPGAPGSLAPAYLVVVAMVIDLAIGYCIIAIVLEVFRKGQRTGKIFLNPGIIVNKPCASRSHSGKKAGTGSAADRDTAERTGETDTFGSQAVDIWGYHLPVPVAA